MISHVTLLLCLTTALQGESLKTSRRTEEEKLPELFAPFVDQFVDANIDKILANFTLHATSNHLFNWTHGHFTLDNGVFNPNNPIRLQLSWGPRAEDNGEIELSHFTKLPVYKFWWLGEYSSLPTRPVGVLHYDENNFYDIGYFPEKKQYLFQVLSKVGPPYDTEAVLDTIYTKIYPKKGVRPFLEPHVSSLVFHKPDLSEFYAPPPRKFDDKDLAQVDLAKHTGKWTVHATTKERADNDHSVAELIHGGEALRFNLMSGNQLVAVSTRYRVSSSGRTIGVFRPVAEQSKAKYPANVRSVTKYTDYLFADGNTILTYSWCATTGTESLKVLVRDGHSVSDYSKIPSAEKIKDLLAKLKTVKK